MCLKSGALGNRLKDGVCVKYMSKRRDTTGNTFKDSICVKHNSYYVLIVIYEDYFNDSAFY